ncbi:hypothetical protein DID88_001139 [Monilinia fructigena]|uniref:Uncharacterized protein n=1 Tax=Monilinia fructigena TaxID=38457 RepID=A0A395IXZ2_9HELO|nr:hypothetical protein DID88_001139 [Monilinia fructigena]
MQQRRKRNTISFYFPPKKPADIDAQIITISSDTERAKSPQQTNQYHQSSAYVQSEAAFLRAQYIVPNILHACGDAREMALKYYRSVFAREIGGAPIYMTIDECRVPDTFLFNNLTALQMLRSRTQNFRVMKNDMDFITSAIVCTNIDKQPYKNPQNLRWITSSLRALDKIWIAEQELCTCERHYRARSRALNLIQYILADVMISQHATVQEKQTLARYTTHAEAIKCVGDTDYCFTKWGFIVPDVKATSVNQLKYIAGRREQSRITLEYLQIILKESSMD